VGSFGTTFLPSPPNFTTENHLIIVEVKLNSNLLDKWLLGTNKELNAQAVRFFRKDDASLTKVVVINGGRSSANVIKEIASGELCDVKYRALQKILIENNINVLCTTWISTETLNELMEENRDIKEENREIKEENREIKDENREIKEENRKIVDALKKNGILVEE
jgi:hypothetical protein